MKLGEKVTFIRHYRKSKDFVDIQQLTNAQENELDETDQIILKRLDEVTLSKPISGYIAGKRKKALSSALGYAASRYNPEADEQFTLLETKSIEVYLVAARMDRIYMVPSDWLEAAPDE